MMLSGLTDRLASIRSYDAMSIVSPNSLPPSPSHFPPHGQCHAVIDPPEGARDTAAGTEGFAVAAAPHPPVLQAEPTAL